MVGVNNYLDHETTILGSHSPPRAHYTGFNDSNGSVQSGRWERKCCVKLLASGRHCFFRLQRHLWEGFKSDSICTARLHSDLLRRLLGTVSHSLVLGHAVNGMVSPVVRLPRCTGGIIVDTFLHTQGASELTADV